MKIQGVNANNLGLFPFTKAGSSVSGALKDIQNQDAPDYSGIEVNISREAQRLLTIMQQEDIDAIERKWYEEFINHTSSTSLSDDERVFHYNLFTNDYNKHNYVQATLKNPQSSRFQNFTVSEKTQTYEYGFQLSGAIDYLKNDVQNSAALANKYSEMKRSIEEQYSGEHLEKQLSYLSEAYDITVDLYSKDQAMRVKSKLVMEQHRISIHNQMVQQGVAGLFNGGIIEIDKGELRDIAEKITSGIREAVSRFAHLAKQFVLENGFITSKQHEADLVGYLMSVERPEGGFSFDELNSINGVFSKRSEFYQEHREKHGHSLQTLPLLNETMFSELKRILG